MEQALNAIHNEAIKLAQLDVPEQARARVDLMIALARYKFDIRGDDEHEGEDISAENVIPLPLQ